MATEELRRLAAREAGYDVVDLSALADDIANAQPLHKCDGCEVELARRAGADIAITAVVHKVSSMLLEVQLRVSDVAGGKVTGVLHVELPGDTDEGWLRGVRRLMASHLGR